MKTLALAVLMGLSQVSTAAVYVYTDEQGNETFTDTPPENVPYEQVQVQPSNTFETPADQQQKNEQFFIDQQQKDDEAAAQRAERRRERAQAKKAVEQAQIALEKAKVIVAGDIFPSVAGGVRYTEQYSNRVNAAERALQEAQDHYKSLK